MNKGSTRLLVLIYSKFDRNDEFPSTQTKISSLEKDFKEMNLNITKMSSDFMITTESIEHAFKRKGLRNISSKTKKDIRNIQTILNKKTMEEKVSGLLEFLPDMKEGTESRNTILRALGKIMYSSEEYLKKQSVSFLCHITGSEHTEKGVLVSEIITTRKNLETRIHAS